MKRIATLDILRGASMLGLVAFHAIDKTMYPGHLDNYFDLPVGELIIFGLIFYLASWRGLFLIISGAANTYAYEEALRSGVHPLRYFLKQLLWGIILLGWGIIVQLFFNPWSGVNDYIVTGSFNWLSSLTNLKWSDALETIGLCLIITSLCQIILSEFKSKRNAILKISFYAILASTIFIIWNPVFSYFEINQGLVPSNVVTMPQTTFLEGFKAFWMGLLIGYQEPIIPYLASFAIGNLLGIILSSPNLTKKKRKFEIGSYSTGVFFVALGFLLWIFRDKMLFGGDFMVPPDWFFFIGLGFQIMVVTACLHAFDFSKRAGLRMKRTKLVRRAGLISLTIFSLQPLDLIPRAFLNLSFKGIKPLTIFSMQPLNLIHLGSLNLPFKVDFLVRGGLDFWQAILCGGVVLIFWIGIVVLWGFINYAFSLDYIFVITRRLLAGKKVYLKDPLRSKEIIKDSEPFMVQT